MLQTGAVLQNGRYVAQGKIAEGGQAIVYRGLDRNLGRVIAIKEFKINAVSASELPAAIAAFQATSKMFAHISHVGVAVIYDYFLEGGIPYLVTEFVDGYTLDYYLLQSPTGLPEAHVVEWGRQLCDVLHFLHSQQPAIIFRDIKPENVMLTSNGQIKLIDFGIARTFKTGRMADTARLGTPGYAPPEQYGGQQTGPYSDIYALGATVFHLITGRNPSEFSAQGSLPRINSISPNHNPQIVDAIQMATNPQIAQRFQTMVAFKDALLPKRPSTTIPQKTPKNPSIPRPLIIMAGAGLMGGGLLMFALAFSLTRVATPNLLGATATRPAIAASDARITPNTTIIPIQTNLTSATATSESRTNPSLTIVPTSTNLSAPPSASTSTPRVVVTSASVAKTSAQVAYARGPSITCSKVIVLDLDTGDEKALSHRSNTHDPSWSPQGDKIVASSGDCAKDNRIIVLFDVLSGIGNPIVTTGNNMNPDWGDDGYIYFSRGAWNTNGDLYRILVSGGSEMSLGDTGLQPVLSPNKDMLVFMQQQASGWRIRLANLSGGRLSRRCDFDLPNVVGAVHARFPSWSPDGRYVLFHVADGGLNQIALAYADSRNCLVGVSTVDGNVRSNMGRPSCASSQFCVANGDEGIVLLRQDSVDHYIRIRQLSRATGADREHWGPAINSR